MDKGKWGGRRGSCWACGRDPQGPGHAGKERGGLGRETVGMSGVDGVVG